MNRPDQTNESHETRSTSAKARAATTQLRRNSRAGVQRAWRLLTNLMMVVLFVMLVPILATGVHLNLAKPALGSLQKLVTSSGDSGAGTLRQALLEAKTGDVITFDSTFFPASAPVTVALQSPLPTIRVNDLTIDASTAGVILDGSQLSHGSGLAIEDAHGVKIHGLQILKFPRHGIFMSGDTRNVIIGGDRSIGAISLGQGNLLSANQGAGVWIEGADASDNKVSGNFIGTDITGQQAYGNGSGGIFIGFGAHNNIVAHNLISGNRDGGIQLQNIGTINNQIVGNHIGTNVDGTQSLENLNSGILIQSGASQNTIGGETYDARNVISGNQGPGVWLEDVGTMANQVLGNYIGVDVTGANVLANRQDGIQIGFYASGNVIGGTFTGARNVISGNDGVGVRLQSAAAGNQILGNYIGTDVGGQKALGNNNTGIVVIGGATNNVIGGATDGARNLISGNGRKGILIGDSGTTGNRILGNYIGTTFTGAQPLGNREGGIVIGNGASNNLIGGTDEGEFNVISGNFGTGIWLESVNTTGNQIVGNYIGTNANNQLVGNRGDGLVMLDGAQGNIVLDNTVHYNKSFAVRWLSGNQMRENDFARNGYNVVEIIGGVLTDLDSIWARQGDLDTYVVTGGNLQVPPGVTWVISPGVNLQFDFGLRVDVQGALRANGTAAEPIRFTPVQRYSSALPGDWGGIVFHDAKTSLLSHTSVEFAKNGLTLEGGEVTMDSSMIAASLENGILVKHGTLTFAGQNTFAGNVGAAIDNQTGNRLNAAKVWWGSASGPRHPDNPGGEGDLVKGNVAVTDFLPDPGAKHFWRDALAVVPGTYSSIISDHRDVHWLRVPIVTRNATLIATLNPPKDYDLFLFSGLDRDAASPDDIGNVQNIDPEDTGNVQNIPGQIALVEGCSNMYIGQLADVGQAGNTARLIAASCVAESAVEQIKSDVWDQSGWYYLLIAGHNGANDAIRPYTLTITVTEGTSAETLDLISTPFLPPSATRLFIKTLILTNWTRLEHRYTQVPLLKERLELLAAMPAVSGEIIDLGDTGKYPLISELYTKWDDRNDNNQSDTDQVVAANRVAAAVKSLLITIRSAYPDLENILIVGGDEIVPFHRVPDEVTIANENTYDAFAVAGSPLAASLRERYFLSDNYYASFNPLPWRGRELFLPDYAIGRLVETPVEMMATIDTFQSRPTLTVTTGLVVGYDFMQDQATEIETELQQRGVAVTPLINNQWLASDLISHWLGQRHDLKSVNAHFDHYSAFPPARHSDGAPPESVRPEHIQQSEILAGTVVFSVGCHSGLSVADGQVTSHHLDFAQALVGKGAAYIANTGFGYGDADAIGYSERLMQLFMQYLGKTTNVGQALRQAKIAYFSELGIRSMTPYDEKVLNVATLYGLPMYGAQLPNPLATAAGAAPSCQAFSQPTPCSNYPALSCRPVSCMFNYEQVSAGPEGVYFNIPGELPYNVLGQPKQPLTGLTITVDQLAAHGALFEGGRYTTIAAFNPVVSRIVTDTINMPEPAYSVFDWRPTTWDLINTVRTPQGRQQRLVVLPAQYRATSEQQGQERLFTELAYTLYYSTSIDTIPPAIWRVEVVEEQARDSMNESELDLQVEATDFSNVVRVAVAYTRGDGIWEVQSLERGQEPNLSNLWSGRLPNQLGLEYFIQAVDGAGNVAVHDNKGKYFQLASKFYLPLILRFSAGTN